MSLHPNIIKKFCELCDWTHQSWITHKRIFEENPDKTILKNGHCGFFLERLSMITSEYTLQQIAKLHDPAVQKNSINLSFEYVINYGGWDTPTLSELRALYDQLEELRKPILSARNKILSHNDLKTILDDLPLGEFSIGLDYKYFEALQKFVDIIYDRTFSGLFPFTCMAINDAEIFVATILKAEQTSK